MWFGIVSLFPAMFSALTDYGVTGRAFRQGIAEYAFWNPRDFTEDKHRTVDDRPYGGGPGMLMKVDPLSAAIEAAKAEKPRATVVYLSPQGEPLNQAKVGHLAKSAEMILIAGRYEGIDERVIEAHVDEEVSIGDYVLSGGELGAMVLMDAVIRQLPGALGDSQSAQQDSFMAGLLDCPHYTRPENYAGRVIPEVLKSGNHELIRKWRLMQSLGRTYQRRPELIEQLSLTEEQQSLLNEYKQRYGIE